LIVVDAVVETNVLGWLDCLFVAGALVATVAAWRSTPVKRGWAFLPLGWFGVALAVDLVVAGLSFVHGSVPMVAGLQRGANETGLYVASVALLLALAQVVVAWLAPSFPRSRWFSRISVGNIVLIAVLGVWHILVNGGSQTTLAILRASSLAP
jgi:hypothetical protein